MANEDKDHRDRWTAFHFSLANPGGPEQEDVPRLLEKVAYAIRELGNVMVIDMSFQSDVNENGLLPSMTLFYRRLGRDEQAP